MSDMGSYSYVYVIIKYTPVESCDDTAQTSLVVVVDREGEALRLVREMNSRDDAKRHPFNDYDYQAVPFKHHN